MAFDRNALLAVRKIQVETIDHQVKLRGNVKNFTVPIAHIDRSSSTKMDSEPI